MWLNMRLYIFTELERGVVKDFLEGKLKPGDMRVAKIRYWMRRSNQLEEDIDLYFKLKEKFG